MKTKAIYILLALVIMALLVACADPVEEQAEPKTVEVTRIVETIVEVANDIEVTRIVEVPVEVTRMVLEEVPVTRIVETEVMVTATAPPPTATPDAPKHGSRQAPVPIGEPLTLLAGDEEIEFDMSVINAVRGEDAWIMVQQANRYNEAPLDGYEWLVVDVNIAYTGEDKGVLEVSKYNVNIVSDGTIVDFSSTPDSASGLEPEFDLELLSGGNAHGLFGFMVPVSEAAPTLLIGDAFFQLFE